MPHADSPERSDSCSMASAPASARLAAVRSTRRAKMADHVAAQHQLDAAAEALIVAAAASAAVAAPEQLDAARASLGCCPLERSRAGQSHARPRLAPPVA